MRRMLAAIDWDVAEDKSKEARLVFVVVIWRERKFSAFLPPGANRQSASAESGHDWHHFPHIRLFFPCALSGAR